MPTEDLDDLLLPNLLHQISFSEFKEWYLSPSVSPLATKDFNKVDHPSSSDDISQSKFQKDNQERTHKFILGMITKGTLAGLRGTHL